MTQVYLVGAGGYLFDRIKNYHYEEIKGFNVVLAPDWSGLKLYLGLEFQLK